MNRPVLSRFLALTFAFGVSSATAQTPTDDTTLIKQTIELRGRPIVVSLPNGARLERENGELVLRGTVANEDDVSRAENALRLLPGIWELRNELRTPTSLSRDSTSSRADYYSRYHDYNYRPPVGEHFVPGHFRADGVYVRDHFKTNPDDSGWNNWSSKGNLNPHTGAIGTKIPKLESTRQYSTRVYNSQPASGNRAMSSSRKK